MTLHNRSLSNRWYHPYASDASSLEERVTCMVLPGLPCSELGGVSGDMYTSREGGYLANEVFGWCGGWCCGGCGCAYVGGAHSLSVLISRGLSSGVVHSSRSASSASSLTCVEPSGASMFAFSGSMFLMEEAMSSQRAGRRNASSREEVPPSKRSMWAGASEAPSCLHSSDSSSDVCNKTNRRHFMICRYLSRPYYENPMLILILMLITLESLLDLMFRVLTTKKSCRSEDNKLKNL